MKLSLIFCYPIKNDNNKSYNSLRNIYYSLSNISHMLGEDAPFYFETSLTIRLVIRYFAMDIQSGNTAVFSLDKKIQMPVCGLKREFVIVITWL